MREDVRKLKKEAFDNLKQNGFQMQEIAKALDMSERQLYRWQSEDSETEPSEATEDAESQEAIQRLEDKVESLTGQLKNLRRQKADEKTKEQLKTEKQIEKHFQAQRTSDRIKDQERQEKIRQIQKIHEISAATSRGKS